MNATPSTRTPSLPVIGRPLPALVLPSTAGAEVRTKGLKQRQPFLLLFARNLDAPACAEWLASLATLRALVDEVSAAVMVVVPVTVDALRDWQASHEFPFTLLADPDRAASQPFIVEDGVAFYAVDRYGYVLARWDGPDASALPTPADALIPIRDAEYEDCGCGLPAWPEESMR